MVEVAQRGIQVALVDASGNTGIGDGQALEQIVGMQRRGSRLHRQRQDGLGDIRLELGQRLFGFGTDIFQQLETHVQVGLLPHCRQHAAGQLGHRFLGRQAGNRVEQPPNRGGTLLFGTGWPERKQFAKQLQG
jgi:hypothetical protein